MNGEHVKRLTSKLFEGVHEFCYCHLHHFPCPQAIPLHDSRILAAHCVTDARRTAFLRALTAYWLPGKSFEILYRSRFDGEFAFHRHCDNKGPTLVLVYADVSRGYGDYVFGGYAGVSWQSASPPVVVSCPDAFLFSVVSPYGGPVKYPIKADSHATALVHTPRYGGPCFHGGMDISFRPDPSGGNTSTCDIGVSYEDVLEIGNYSLTGGEDFSPGEVEVYAVV